MLRLSVCSVREESTLLLGKRVIYRGSHSALARARAGPNTLVGLAKPADAESPFKRAEAVAALLPAYEAVLKELAGLGVPEVQLHEPILTHSEAASLKADFEATYKALSAVGVPINLARARSPTTCSHLPAPSALHHHRLCDRH